MFNINITGVVAEAEAEVHDAIHALTKDFMDGLHRLEGVKVESAAVSTPTKSANLAHAEAATTAGGTAAVTGTDLHTHEQGPGTSGTGGKTK